MTLPFIFNDLRPLIMILLASLQIIILYTVAILTEEKLYRWLLIPLVVELILVIFPFYFLPKFLRWRDTEVIGTFLRMMRDRVLVKVPNADVRCSIFRPSFRKRRLIEALICTKDGLARRKNKKMRASQGVAGTAYRTKQTTYILIEGDWKTQQMTNFGFTEQEVSRFKSDRGSYLSIPVMKRGDEEEVEVLAVVSLDSDSGVTFTAEVSEEITRISAYIANIL